MDMPWNNEKAAIITRARLMAMPPDAVYRELEQYGSYLLANTRYSYDKELETALLSRGDPLINLGLAEFGGVSELASNLYAKASSGADDLYKRALRIAVISNQTLADALMGPNQFGVLPDIDLQRIVKAGDSEELHALLGNPKGKKLIAKLLNRKSPFDAISEDRFLQLIYIATRNPSLNDDDGSVDGPDMDAWDIQKGILKLLKTTTVSEDSLEAFHYLLSSIDPAQAYLPDEDMTPIFSRWQQLKVSEKFKEKYSERMGRSTLLDFKDEFACLMASLYGLYSADKKSTHLGSLDSPNVVLRCCFYGTSHYGQARMSAKDMEQAYNRDGEVFIYAALHSRRLLQDNEARAIVEEHMSGPHQIWLYHRRCLQIKKHRADFNSNPVTQCGADLMGDLIEKPSAEMQRLNKLETQVVAISKQVGILQKTMQWSLVGLVAILILALRHVW